MFIKASGYIDSGLGDLEYDAEMGFLGWHKVLLKIRGIVRIFVFGIQDIVFELGR
jgi:hypothetical protein